MPPSASRFDSRVLLDRLGDFPPARRYLVGFSGGADSTALLTALHARKDQLQAHIEALHFNHGLQDDAPRWRAHCEDFCTKRGIPLTCQALEISSRAGNVEARAREARYRYVEEHLDSKSLYLTAHNADDRAETFLMHALRGSGLKGLASIPDIRPLGRGYVVRPLLEFHRSELTQYLQDKGIGWIEDPSNLDTDMDRNFLRQEVIPLLESRWPAARKSLARSSRHLRTAGSVLHELLLQQTGLDDHDGLVLPLAVLDSLGAPARSLVLRAWLEDQGAPSLPESRLEEFTGQLDASEPGSQCETSWSGWTLKRFRDAVHLVPPGPDHECPRLTWEAGPVLDLGPGLGTLQLTGKDGPLPDRWSVAPRKPGGSMQLHHDGPRRKLKKVFQEQGIPPWRRQAIPVLYWDDEAVALGDWCLAPRFRRWLTEHGLGYRWEPSDPQLRHLVAEVHDLVSRARTA